MLLKLFSSASWLVVHLVFLEGLLGGLCGLGVSYLHAQPSTQIDLTRQVKGVLPEANIHASIARDSEVPGDTDDLSEGSVNRYFTDALARAAVSAGANVAYVEGTGVFSVPSFPYSSLTSVPSTFAPVTHAATHDLGGGDELAPDWSQIDRACTTVVFSATPTFDAAASNCFVLGLTDDVTSSTLSGEKPGPLALTLKQDGTGGRTFVWPAEVVGACSISPEADAATLALLWVDSDGVTVVECRVKGGADAWTFQQASGSSLPSPASGEATIFQDSDSGEFSVKKPGGAVVSLESGGSGDPVGANVGQSFTSQTSVELTHGFGHNKLVVVCYDASGVELVPATTTIAGSDPFSVTVTFASATTGRCVVSGGGGGAVGSDDVGTSELNDDANTPTAGDFVIVETGAASFDYLTPNAGTDVSADLEEETHASEHAENAADEILGESLGTACIENQILKANATGGLDCAADITGGSPTFDQIGGGTNTNSAMVVGTGASLGVSGSGTIDATTLSSTALAAFLLETELDAIAELQAQIADATLLTTADEGTGNGIDADTVDGVEATAFVLETEIDTFSELDTLVADQTLVHSGSNIATATALAANGSNCSAGQWAAGVDASGAAEGCTADDDIPESGDFGNAADLELTGAISSGAVTTAKVEAELKTVTKSWAIADPATGDAGNMQLMFQHAITITEVNCSTDTGTMTIQMDERALTTPNTGGTDVMTAQLVCDSDNQQTIGFDNAGIAADALLNIDIDAVASLPTQGRIHVTYTID